MADSSAKRAWSVEGVDPDAAAIAKSAADAAGMTISEWLSQAILKNTGYQTPGQAKDTKPNRPTPVGVDVSDDFAESETIVRSSRRDSSPMVQVAASGDDSAKHDAAPRSGPAAPPPDGPVELDAAEESGPGEQPEPESFAPEGGILPEDTPNPDFPEPGESGREDGEETAESREIREAMEEIRRTIVFASAVPVPGEDAGGTDGGSATDTRFEDAGEDENPTLVNRAVREDDEPIATAEPEVEDRGPPLPLDDLNGADIGAGPAPSGAGPREGSGRSGGEPGIEIARDGRVTPEDGLIVAAEGRSESELPLDYNPHAPGADYRLAPDDLAALRTIVAAGEDAGPEPRRRRPWILLLLLLIAGGIATGAYFYPEQSRQIRERITATVSGLWSSIRGIGDKKKPAGAGVSGSGTIPPPAGTSGTPSGSSESAVTPGARMPEGAPPMPPGQNPGWYKQAAEAGNANAQYVLAGMFLRGNGIPKDTERAASWLMKAADRGHAQAQFALAELYERGEGVKADPVQAVRWYEMAARQQHGLAQLRLGEIYLVGGADVSRDFGKAHLWLIRAAKSGVPDAQYALGIMYRDGLGIPADNAVAFKWFTFAAQSGHNKAEEAVRDLDGRLTGSERAEARNLLKEPRPTPKPPEIAGAMAVPGSSGGASGSRAGGNSGASIIVEPGPTPRGKTIIIRDTGSGSGTGTASSGAAGGASGGTAAETAKGKTLVVKTPGLKTPEVKAAKPPEVASKPPAAKPVAAPKVKPAGGAATPDPRLAHIQKLLAQLHLDPGNTEGLPHPKTREAIRLYQKTAGLKVTGTPSAALLKHLQAALGAVNSTN